MNDIYQLLVKRNAQESNPFRLVYESNAMLLRQVDYLEKKWKDSERELLLCQSSMLNATAQSPNATMNTAAAAALRNENKLRSKLEKIQDELTRKVKAEAEEKAIALKLIRDLAEAKEQIQRQEKTVQHLKDEYDRAERAIEHLTNEVESAQSDRNLAEQQYEGLKRTIRTLQEENDSMAKENRELEARLVTEKTKITDEMQTMSDTVDAMKKEIEMLRSFAKQESSRKTWFGGLLGTSDSTKKGDEEKHEESRKWGAVGVIVPTVPKQCIKSHAVEITCARYDGAGSDLLATSSNDSTVKVWDTNSGSAKATLRGTAGHPMLCCDIHGFLAVGAGTDKTCRVWNLTTERMLHHLVGHNHKITCVRLISNDRCVATGSADRTIKLWDISRTTYRQTTTLRHSSTVSSMDVGSDSSAVVTGHMDGILRVWDLRTGTRTIDICDIHEGGITAVRINPANNVQVLTNALDSCLKMIDLRNKSVMQTYRNPEFHTKQSWSSCALSPDGKYAIAGSNLNGLVHVWDATNGSLKAKLQGHSGGVCCVDWSLGGLSGQQVASADTKGSLILWS